MHNLCQLMNTFPFIAQATNNAARPQPTSPLWIIVPAAILGTATLFWWLSKRAEKSVHNQITLAAAKEVAHWLQTPLNAPTIDILNLLTSTTAPESFVTQYNRLIDAVAIQIERREKSYFLEITIHKNNAELFNSKRQIAYDDLPIAVQTAFLKGETRLQLPWSPTFQKPPQSTSSRG